MVYVVEMIDTMIKSSSFNFKKALKMKRKFFGIVIVAIIAIIASWNISRRTSNGSLTDLALNNIEALADPEVGDPIACIYYGCTPYVWYDCHIFLYGIYTYVCYNYRGY